ncbi:hypothetical protein D3C74_39670 [compost metagenome]
MVAGPDSEWLTSSICDIASTRLLLEWRPVEASTCAEAIDNMSMVFLRLFILTSRPLGPAAGGWKHREDF